MSSVPWQSNCQISQRHCCLDLQIGSSLLPTSIVRGWVLSRMLLLLVSQLLFQPHCLFTQLTEQVSFLGPVSFLNIKVISGPWLMFFYQRRGLCVGWQMHIQWDSEKTGSGRHCIWRNLSRNSPFKDTTTQWLSLT